MAGGTIMCNGKVIECPGDVTFAKLNIRNNMKFIISSSVAGGGNCL